MPTATCPVHEDLVAFALGTLPEGRADEVAEHVADCADCASAIERLSHAGDSLASSLRRAADDEPFLAEPECRQALERVQALGSPAPTSPAAAAALGTVRDYRLLEKLGEGGMGAVYKAEHVRLKRLVALKVLAEDRLGSREAVTRFLREMEAVGRLQHPNIVQAHDAGEHDGQHYLVMEYVPGLDLAHLVHRYGPLRIADACEIIRQAALALEHAAGQGLIHRDIKPSNLMLTPSGQVKLLDLGLARLGEDHFAGDQTATELTACQVVGTLDYMAPEQAGDSHLVNIRVDIYSLGATLYKLLCGKAPFESRKYTNAVQRIGALLEHRIQPIAERRPDVAPELAAVVERLLARKPAARPRTAAAVAAALAPFAAGADLAGLMQRLMPDALDPDTAVGVLAPTATGPDPTAAAATEVRGQRSEVRDESFSRDPAGERSRDPAADAATQAADSATPAMHFAGPLAGRAERSFKSAKRRASPAAKYGLAAMALTAIIAAAVFVVRIATDNGTLIIESSEPGVEVTLRRSGEKVDDLELTQGHNETTVRSGEYEVLLKGANTDGLRVENKRFTLTRGGKAVVKIQRLEAPAGTQPPVVSNDASAELPVEAPIPIPHPVDWEFVRAVSKLSPEVQVAAVADRLKQLNHGFDGKLEHRIENGAIVELKIVTDFITDISPVRALEKLSRLYCNQGSSPGSARNPLADLSPIQGMKLTQLDVQYTAVEDLSPLRGMPLTNLYCFATKIADLSPLKEMALRNFDCRGTPVADLAPLAGMPLDNLQIGGTKVSTLAPLKGMPLRMLLVHNTRIDDLSPLEGMPLEHLVVTGTAISDLSPVRGMKLKYFNCWDTLVSDLSPLAGMPLEQLYIQQTRVSDLSPLAGMPLSTLSVTGTAVADLTPLEAMPLVYLNLSETSVTNLAPLAGITTLKDLGLASTAVSDLGPLRGQDLTGLNVRHTPVSDLSPLDGMGLATLHCDGAPISDFSPLKDMPLKAITCDLRSYNRTWNETLRSLPLEHVNGQPAADFWQSVEDRLQADEAFNARVAALPPEEQIAAVAKRLMELNPGSEGRIVNHKIVNGDVLRLGIDVAHIMDLSPLRALTQLDHLQLTATQPTWLCDLSPLRGLKLKWLELCRSFVSDLSPLAGMPLEYLAGRNSPVSDLSPLKEMPLKHLDCAGTRVADLSPLKGMDLQVLFVGTTAVTDLSPLAGMPLKSFGCRQTRVSDLSPLSGMPLAYLQIDYCFELTDGSPLAGVPLKVVWLHNTPVADFSPLRGAPLKSLWCDARPYDRSWTETLKSLPLETINDMPAAQFWASVESRLRADEEFNARVAALPPEEQVQAVAQRLHELNPGADHLAGGLVQKHAVEDGHVTLLHVRTESITDIAPVRALPGLKRLICEPLSSGTGLLMDLSPLRGMALAELSIGRNAVSDLSPLKGAPLEQLWIHETRVSELSALDGMPLRHLYMDKEAARANADFLRSVETLETINEKPAAEVLGGG